MIKHPHLLRSLIFVSASFLFCCHIACQQRPEVILRPEPRRTSGQEDDTRRAGPVAIPDTLRIGAWNIEHFGSPNSRQGVGHRVAQDIEKLASVIAHSDLDILALAEIYADEPAEQGTWTSAGLDELLGELNSLLPPSSPYGWDYLLFGNASLSDRSQLCGVLWNWNVIDEVTWWRIPVDDGKRSGKRLWDRTPHAVKFSSVQGRTDFVVVSLHMKAGNSFIDHREVEADQLVEGLDSIRTTLDDWDIILIGDTNCANPSEKAVRTFTQAGFADLNGGQTATVPWGPPLDRAFVANDATRNGEFNGDFTVIHGAAMDPPLSETDFRKWCSDHFLIYSSVKLVQDDD